MTASTTLEPAKPTLAEQLRYIDIVLECTAEAREQLVAEGKVPAQKPFGWDASFDPETIAQCRMCGDLAAELIARKVKAEGLNPAVITSDRANAAYWDDEPEARAAMSYVPMVQL